LVTVRINTLSQLELVFLANSAAVLAEGASHRRARRSGSDSDSWLQMAARVNREYG
jgi:hypothetical protein